MALLPQVSEVRGFVSPAAFFKDFDRWVAAVDSVDLSARGLQIQRRRVPAREVSGKVRRGEQKVVTDQLRLTNPARSPNGGASALAFLRRCRRISA